MLIARVLPTLVLGVGSVLADGTSIVNAIAAIQNATNELTTTVSNWNGNILGALPIIVQSTELLNTIKKGTQTAEESAALADLEAVTVGLATITLVGNVNASLDTIVDAKPKFDRDLLTPVVLLNLEQERSASADFSDAVVSKLPATFASTGQQLAAQISEAFSEAISVYSGGILSR
ncbi:hypothetical protein LA080_016012 [Diaporthe eres]|uniref:Antigenic cell wall galactomannoprotein n=1 Tax=Diaporthe vaccinii TaxID=105482 RepID=A0ABR4E074_9PEZI|nr:hypothetical protein LA080_016012 [Diaporthe eres]